jgi:hypothetical protein
MRLGQQAVLVVVLFGPWAREQRVDAGEAFRGDCPPQNRSRVAQQYAHIGQPRRGDSAQGALHAFPLQFDAHKVAFGVLLGARHEVVAAAKANLQLHRRDAPKQTRPTQRTRSTSRHKIRGFRER